MPRGLTAAQKAQLAAHIRRPAYFVALALPSVTVRMWSGVGNVTALGETWLGAGEYGMIEGLDHDRSLRATSISVSLVGVPGEAVPGSALAQARETRYQGRPLSIYLGFMHLETDALLSDPTLLWVGFADTMAFRLGATISITLTGDPLSGLLRRSNGLRMTTESHNQRLGNPATKDLFFEVQNRLMGMPRPQVN